MEKSFPQLAQTCCWLLSPAGPVFGTLSLSGAELSFSPAPGDDEHRLRLPHTRILGATVTPIKRRLLVQGNDQTWWFTGPSVHTLGRRLAALLHPTEGSFAPDEPMLGSAPVWCGRLHGEACLTDRRLYFQASGPWALIARILGQPAQWDIPYHAVRVLGSGLEVRVGAQVLQLQGTGALLLGAHIQEKPQLAWPTRWREGWRRQSGVLALQPDRLQLVTDLTAPREVPLRDIRRLALSGSRLRIELPEQTLSIETTSSGILLRRLAAAALSQPARSLAPGRQPVLWWQTPTDARIGHLQLTQHLLRFLSPEGEAILERPMAGIRRTPSPHTQIRLADEQGRYRFEPAHRGGLVEHFWQNYRPPERTQPWPRTSEGRHALLHGQRSIWISDRRRYEVLLQPGMLLDQGDGFGVVLPASSGPPQAGVPLTVELGRPDGVYQLDTTLLRTAPLPPGMRFPRNGRVAVLRFPEEVRFYNQRKAFRVALKMPINAWRLRLDQRRNTWIPDGERLSGQLLDLSVSGCGVHTDAEVTIGEHLFLELLVAEHWLPLEAECVRAEPGWPEGSNLGLQFLNLPERLEQLLNQTILQQQRTDTGMMTPE